MREALRGVRLMVSTSWRADAVRSVGVLVTASGQFLVLPLRALGLEELANGALARRWSQALLGVLLIVALSGANRLMAWASLNLRVRLREHTQLYLDSHLMGLTAGIPGIAHHELPEYLDSVERLRSERPYLANPFNPISWTLASLVQGGIVMALLGSVNPLFALLPLLGLPAAIVTARTEQQSIALLDTQAENQRVARHLLDLSIESGPAKEIRVFGLGDELLGRRRHLFSVMESERRAVARRGLGRVTVCWALFALGYGGALYWTAQGAGSGRGSVGAVALVLTLGAQLNAQLAELALNVAWFSRSLRAVRRLVWFSDYSDQARRAVVPAEPVPPPSRLAKGIRFEGVDFAYPDATRSVLSGVELFLPAGSTVAIVGENGAGKTTLVKLLARMYEPTAGRILIDDIPLDAMPIDDWRRCLSAGFQDFGRLQLIARRSVGAGDTFAEPTDEVVRSALVRAVAPDLVTRLPDGFDSQLGRDLGGVELSVGQWQKVALGRAMMRTAPLILMLDEPTASLDAPTEHALFERFAGAAREVASDTGGVTILVSHRFSTVRMADCIVVLGHGRVLEMGSHVELMQRDGTYADLYRLQARAYNVVA